MHIKVPYDDLVLTPAIIARVAKPDGEDGCWLYGNSLGYANITVQGYRAVAHRLFYTALVGPVPTGLVLDHLCRVLNCVNPAHLEAVTHAENCRRGINWNAQKTHCANGHPFEGRNVIRGSYGRQCRTCNLAATARYRQRRRGRAA